MIHVEENKSWKILQKSNRKKKAQSKWDQSHTQELTVPAFVFTRFSIAVCLWEVTDWVLSLCRFIILSWPPPGVKLRSNEGRLPNPPVAVEELDPSQATEGIVINEDELGKNYSNYGLRSMTGFRFLLIFSLFRSASWSRSSGLCCCSVAWCGWGTPIHCTNNMNVRKCSSSACSLLLVSASWNLS